jgi:hypothetical protein
MKKLKMVPNDPRAIPEFSRFIEYTLGESDPPLMLVPHVQS